MSETKKNQSPEEQDVLEDNAPEIDITDVYHDARRTCFAQCERRELHAKPGQAILIHRLSLHGMAPWRSDAEAPRIVAYFRPEGRLEDWPVV